MEKKKNLEKTKKDALNAQLMEVVEKQRLYYKTVRDFQEVCITVIRKRFESSREKMYVENKTAFL